MNIPKIRFNGFEGEWQGTSLSKIATIQKGEQINKSCLADSGTYYVLNGGQTPSGYTESYNTPENTISISEGGNSCGYIAYNTSKFWSGGHNYTLRNVTIHNEYLYAFLKSKEEFIMSLRVGSGLPNIQKSALLEVAVDIPNEKEEQQQIAAYFGQLDLLIEATGKKVASLKQTKQACLQSMFPQPGETKPRIRFRGFEGVWQLRKIGELGTTYSGLSGKSKADFGLGSAQYITFLNVLTNAHIDTTIFESVNIKPGEKQNKVVKGDILFNTSSETPEEVGYCSVLMNDIDNLYLNSFCFGFRPYAGTINPEFMVYLMRGQIGRSIMKILAQGATRYNLSKNRLCEVTIPIPANDDEQQQIAAFFSNMDKQIRIQEQRLEKLKRIKTACLENMFV